MVLPPNSPEDPADDETVALPIPDAPDVRIGPYKVLRKLGAGAMGEVYLAEDVRLDRRIALKVLPAQFTQEPDRVRRFVREAKAASALNHPNIITIFEIGESDHKHYISTEYIEGQTLRQKMAGPRLTIEMAIDVGIQMASALNAAHGAGIIHRDMKPENVMLRPDGLVKVLDFGVAKLTEKTFTQPPAVLTGSEDQGAVSLNDAYATTLDPNLATPELTIDGTEPGMILGTLTYMSPEQLRGLKVDARSDIFSLGVMLYEFIAGSSPFGGGAQVDKIAAILNQQPAPLVQYRPDTPADLQRIIGKALQKDRDSRYQHVSELLTELRDLKRELEFQEKLDRSGKAVTPVGASDHARGAMALAGRRWKALVPGAVAVVALIAVGLYWLTHRTPTLTDKDTIVLADFVNTTGDSVFEGTLKEALSSELARSPFLKVLSDKRVLATLKQMNRPMNQRLTQDVAREVGMRTNSKVYMLGSIAEVGNHYRIEVKALSCATGNTVASVETAAEDRDTVVKALGEAGNQMRRKLGESLPSLAKFNVPLEQATTSSLEALQALALARVVMREQGLAAGIPYLKRAVELDPNFAVALSTLGIQYVNLGQTSAAIPYLQRAFDLRNRLGALERLAIETRYYTFATGELEKAIQSYKEWCEIDPGNSTPRNNLGLTYSKVGRYEEAAEIALEALRIEPDSYTILNNLVLYYRRLDRFDEATAFFEKARGQNLDGSELRSERYIVAFLQKDTAAMQEQLAVLASRADRDQLLLLSQSEVEAYIGHLGNARAALPKAVDSAASADANEAAATWKAYQSVREAEVGNAELARKMAAEALSLNSGQDVQELAAFALARAGDAARAQKLAEILNQESPHNTLVQGYWLPTIRAAIALDRKNPREAIETLRVASSLELAEVAFPGLYPVYMRGIAYLAAGLGAEAAGEFRKILENQGIMSYSTLTVLAQIHLARAEAVRGDKNAANNQYQDFLALWKDADSDIPILKQAKQEYARLNAGE